jgi:hypothetical protein
MVRFTGALVLAGLLCVGVGARAQQASLAVDYVEPKDWVQKSIVKFYIDLLDGDYRVISGLSSQDVEIKVSERPDPVRGIVEVQQFRDTTEGVAIAILMAGHNAYAPMSVEEEDEGMDGMPQIFPNQKEGVKNFLRKLDPAGDKAAIFIYDESGIRTVDTFSNMFPEAVSAVDKAKVQESQAGQPGQRLAPRLFNNILEVVEDKFGSEEDLPRRKILLIMSDGLDVYSGRPDRIDQMIKDIVQAARGYNIKIYALGATPGNPDNLRYLKEIAVKTEGAYREIGPKEWVNIPDIFAGLAEEIKKQYVITFKSEELESGRPLKFRVVAKTGGRTLEAEYAKDVKLDDKPFNWMKIVWIAVGVIGGLVFLFVIIKLIVFLKNRQPAQQEEQVVEYTGPSKGRLTITTGPHAGEEYHLTKDLTTIGKMQGNDIVLNRDDSTSKRHAGIKIDDMRYELADFGSTNGTFVNGRKINKQFLRDGDRIKLGETEMAFHLK